MPLSSFLTVPLVSLTLAASGSICPDVRPAVSIKPVVEKTKYYKAQSTRELTQLHTGRHRPETNNIGGLAYDNLEISGGETKFEVRKIGSQACVSLKSVELEYRVFPTVYIASNFSRGSCEYRAVMIHENKHVKVLKHFHKQTAPMIRGRLSQIVNQMGPLGPLPMNKVGAAQARMHKHIQAALADYISRDLYPVLNARQSYVDRPEEYAHVFSKCDSAGWDKKFYEHNEMDMVYGGGR